MDFESTGIIDGGGALKHVPIAVQKTENVFKPDINDFVFALVTFALGYLFSRWVFFFWQGWGVTVFTSLYLFTVTAYLVKKGAFVSCGASLFWFVVTLLSGLSYSLWENIGISNVRSVFLFCSAVYMSLLHPAVLFWGKPVIICWLTG